MPRKPFRLALAQRVCRPLPPLLAHRVRTVIYPQKQAFDDNHEFEVQSQIGSRFRHTTSDLHAYPFSVHGYYDWRSLAVALATCSPGDHIIEIGANIGTETIGFADIVGKMGCVSAFEPLPANAESIRQNANLNSLDQIRLYPLAVGAVNSAVEFVIPPDQHASGVGYVTFNKNNDLPKIKVQSVTLDSLKEELGPSQLIYMDVEGAEVDVLRGAKEYISEYQPTIVLEIVRSNLKRAGYTVHTLLEELAQHHYRVFRIGRFGLQDVDSSQIVKNGNGFCVPQTRSELARAASKMVLRCGLAPCVRGLNPIAGAKHR